ncbi:hypothetical protein MRX96_033799 [Rhipicephalus microplus]
MNAFAEQRFRLEARLARACLCFFASGSWHGNFEDYVVTSFRSSYAVYVTLTATAMLVFEGFLMLRCFYSVTPPGESSFIENLYTVLRLIITVKVLVTLFIVNLSTDAMVQALQAAKRLELSIGFLFAGRRRRRLLLVQAPCENSRICHAATGPSCLPRRSRLARDARHVHPDGLPSVDGTQHILFGAHATGETRRAVRAIERLRTSLLAVTTIVRKTDKRLRPAVVVDFLCSAIAACAVVHAAFYARATSAKLFFTALYAISTSMSVVDASLSAGDIRTQVQSLKALLETASTLSPPPRVSRQAELLAITIDYDRFCFTGSGFFTVDRSMLTSFVAVVMTYSLILVQSVRKTDAPVCSS